LKQDFLVPNIQGCDGYTEGLSDAQARKIAAGYDANDQTVKFDANGQLVLVATGKPAPSKVATTTTTTTKPSGSSTTTTTTTAVGGN
jgi:hypothetical protein